MDYMDPYVCQLRKAIKLDYSLTNLTILDNIILRA